MDKTGVSKYYGKLKNRFYHSARHNGMLHSDTLLNIALSPDFLEWIEYLKTQKDLGSHKSDDNYMLKQFLNEQGLDALPVMVDDQKFLKLSTRLTKVYRGVKSPNAIDEMLYDKNLYVGSSNKTNGIYFIAGENAKDYSYEYANFKKDQVVTALIHPKAKILDVTNLNKLCANNEQKIKKYLEIKKVKDNSGELAKAIKQYLNADISVNAIMEGYDVIRYSEIEFYVVLNKSALIMSKKTDEKCKSASTQTDMQSQDAPKQK